jgi:hypothetical protein
MSIDPNGVLFPPTTRSPEIVTLPSVPVKACCGALAGDVCDCAAFAAEARGVFARPIFWDLRTSVDAT